MMKLGAWPRKGRDDMLYDAEELVKNVTPCKVDAKRNIRNNVDHTLDIINEKADAAQEVKDNPKNDDNTKSTKGETKTKIKTHVREEHGNVQRLPRA